MSEHTSTVDVYGFTDRDPREASLAITEEQATEFNKLVAYWSGAFDVIEAARAGDASKNTLETYIQTVAPHRLGTNLERASTHTSMRYKRGNMEVICTSTNDSSSLVVEERTPQAGSNLDEIKSIAYVIDGPTKEAIQHTWLVDRATNELVDDSTEDLDDFITFGEEHTSDITIPEDEDDTPSFTRGQFWEAQDIFAMLEEGDWQSSYSYAPEAV